MSNLNADATEFERMLKRSAESAARFQAIASERKCALCHKRCNAVDTQASKGFQFPGYGWLCDACAAKEFRIWLDSDEAEVMREKSHLN